MGDVSVYCDEKKNRENNIRAYRNWQWTLFEQELSPEDKHNTHRASCRRVICL